VVHVLYIQLLILSKGFLLTFEKDIPLCNSNFQNIEYNFLVTVNVSFIVHQQKKYNIL
jgi:hypothetical protein